MASRSLIAIATAWGPKHGGINAFNQEFVAALGVAFHNEYCIVCVVPQARPEEIEDARRSFVSLRVLATPPKGEVLDASHAAEIVRSAGEAASAESVWIGHDLFTGAAAAEAAAQTGARVALVNHMSYLAYKPFQTGCATVAREKSRQQKAIFERAHWLFAVGPLLRDELTDLVGQHEIHMIVPGLPEIEPVAPPKRWTMVLFGRLDPETDRIKQGRLGVAAFARAHRDAVEQAGLSGHLQDPRLKLFGVADGDEAELRAFAADQARAVLDILPLPFEEDRRELLRELAHSSVAVMPSWHEGFGLVGWEAIGAGIPLVLGTRSGLYKLLDEKLAGAGTGCVHAVKIRGSESQDAPFDAEDVVAVADALKRIAADRERALRSARMLRELLAECTWARCARQFIEDIGWSVPATVRDVQPEAVVETPASRTTMGESSPRQLVELPEASWFAGHGYAESLLLRADEECVPFHPGHANVLDEFLAWARRQDGFPVQVRLLTGPGGAGKTRLSLELCRRLAPAWKAGFLVSHCPAAEIPPQFEALLARHAQVLVVVDYAETRRDELAALVTVALSSRDRRIRLVLLARDAGEWWDRLASDYPACERIFGGTATSGPYALPPLHPNRADREAAYDAALRAFAGRIGVEEVEPHTRARPDLSAEYFGSPLYIQMAALLALRGERTATATGLTDGLVRHEEHYWRRVCGTLGIQGGDRAAAHLVALATLCNGLGSAREAGELYERTDGPACSRSNLALLFRTLSALYPGRKGLQPLRPDLLGEALVSRVLALAAESRGGVLRAVLGARSSDAIRRQGLTVLTRLARGRPDARLALLEAVMDNFVPALDSIIDVSLQTGEPLPEIAEEAFVRLPMGVRSQAAGILPRLVPHRSVRLAELALRGDEVRLASSRLAHGRKRSQKSAAELAHSLYDVSLRLENLGRMEEGLAAATEAVEFLTALASETPEDYQWPLASALSNTANLLSEVGQYDEALARAREAHAIRARLAQTQDGPAIRELASSLRNLSNHLSDIGHFEEAFQTARDAHDICSRFAASEPESYDAALAGSLSNLSNRSSDLGHFEDALAQARAATEIYARLAKARPDRYEPELAGTLNNLGNRLANVGQFDDALARALEAYAIHRRLADARPGRFEVDLAMSLHNLANHLGHLGHLDDALARTQEAHEMYVRLARARPNRYEFEVANALFNYSRCLSVLGKPEAALMRAREAHAIYKRLHGARPERYGTELANCLMGLGECLADLRQSGEALACVREGHAMLVELAGRRPRRLAYDLLDAELTLQRLLWLARLGKADWFDAWPDRERGAVVPPFRRTLLRGTYAVIAGSLAHDADVRLAVSRMTEAIALLEELPSHHRRAADRDYVAAIAYLAANAPSPVHEAQWRSACRAFLKAHGGSIPAALGDTLQRLGCAALVDASPSC